MPTEPKTARRSILRRPPGVRSAGPSTATPAAEATGTPRKKKRPAAFTRFWSKMRRPRLRHSIWRRSRAVLVWGIILAAALLDPGTILAILVLTILAAAALLILSMVGAVVTTAQLLRQMMPNISRRFNSQPGFVEV